MGDDLVSAHIVQLVLGTNGEPVLPTHDPGPQFSELAMYVLVRRGSQWWPAAGQNTPMRPGGAVKTNARTGVIATTSSRPRPSQEHAQQRTHFLKNLAMLGALLFVATDRRHRSGSCTV